MAYRRTILIKLGSGNTGFTLKAQLVDETGANVGGEVTTGFTEIASGDYLWDYSAYPDGHRGAVKILKTDNTYMTSIAVNPEDYEDLDAKVSTRTTPAQVATELGTYDGPTHAEMTAEHDVLEGEHSSLDTAIGTRAIPSDVTTAHSTTDALINGIDDPSAATIATAVWASGTRTLTSFGTLVADTASAVWNKLTSALTTAGSIGKLLVDNVNAAIGSRATPSDVTTAHGTTDGLIGGLNNLSQAQSEAAADAALATYDGPTHAEMTAEHDILEGEHSALSVEHGTIEGKVDAVPTASQNADAVLTEAVTDHKGTAGSLAKFIWALKALVFGGQKVVETTEDTVLEYYDEDGVKVFTATKVGSQVNITEH